MQEWADRHHLLALYSDFNKVVVSEFSFNLNGNLRNDGHRKFRVRFLGVTLTYDNFDFPPFNIGVADLPGAGGPQLKGEPPSFVNVFLA